jgi:drug/metabolite transporter (DMT)-like permease
MPALRAWIGDPDGSYNSYQSHFSAPLSPWLEQLTYPSGTSDHSQRFFDRRWVGRLLLAFVCVIWGSTFALNKLALQHIGVFAFLTLRFALAYLVMVVVGLIFGESGPGSSLRLLRPQRAAMLPGIFLFLSYALQTLGLRLISPATSGFLTGLSVILVPILGMWFKKKLTARQMVASLVALVGLGLVSTPLGAGESSGDLLTLGCAVAVALQILLTEELVRSERMSPLKLVVDQLLVVTVLSGVLSLTFDTHSPARSYSFAVLTNPIVIVAITVTAILATALAFVAQTHYQRTISSAELAVIFNLEPLFALVFGVIITSTIPGRVQVVGGLVIVSAMMISALGSKRDSQPSSEPVVTEC